MSPQSQLGIVYMSHIYADLFEMIKCQNVPRCLRPAQAKQCNSFIIIMFSFTRYVFFVFELNQLIDIGFKKKKNLSFSCLKPCPNGDVLSTSCKWVDDFCCSDYVPREDVNGSLHLYFYSVSVDSEILSDIWGFRAV